ncbi:hypothetical protein [Desulfobacterium sp. N47]|uniref:hypothetical protein n=1 Tax=Desulfobacterium sp. N47 TaxID=3115210 RepID=UPI003F4A7C50
MNDDTGTHVLGNGHVMKTIHFKSTLLLSVRSEDIFMGKHHTLTYDMSTSRSHSIQIPLRDLIGADDWVEAFFVGCLLVLFISMVLGVGIGELINWLFSAKIPPRILFYIIGTLCLPILPFACIAAAEEELMRSHAARERSCGPGDLRVDVVQKTGSYFWR